IACFGQSTSLPARGPRWLAQDVGSTSDAISVDVGGSNACVVSMSGDVGCWGSNWGGQVSPSISATVHELRWRRDVRDARRVAAGGRRACVILKCGRVACWGSTSWGEPGIGKVLLESTEIRVPPLVSIDLSSDHACGIDVSGAIY